MPVTRRLREAVLCTLDAVKTYTLLDGDGHPYQSPTRGSLGGHRRSRIYGRLDCPSALRWIAAGHYVQHRVFFADEAVAILQDGDMVAVSGFVGIGTPDELILALARRFESGAGPHGLGLMFAAAPGDGKERGLNRLAHPGLVKRAIGGHWALVPKLAKLALDNEIEAYNLPLGCIAQLYRDIAARRAGLLSRVGLHTFVDPRQDGGKINARTTEDLVELLTLHGEEYLLYKAFPINVALIRGTSADPSGNISFEKEALTLDCLAQAMAARNNGGIVIAQVERIVDDGFLLPKDVRVPGILVDCVVLAEPEMHRMNYGVQHDAALAGQIRVPVSGMKKMPLDARKVIARRAAFELPPNGVVNLGVGAPEGIAALERVVPDLKLVTASIDDGLNDAAYIVPGLGDAGDRQFGPR